MNDNYPRGPSSWSLMLTAARLALSPASEPVKQQFIRETEIEKKPSVWQRTKDLLTDSDSDSFSIMISVPITLSFVLMLFAGVGVGIAGRKLDLGIAWVGAAASDLHCMAYDCPPAILNAFQKSEVAPLLVDRPQQDVAAKDAAVGALEKALDSDSDIVAIAKGERLALLSLLDAWHGRVIEKRALANMPRTSQDAIFSFLGALAKGDNAQDAAKTAMELSKKPTLTPSDIQFDRKMAIAKKQLTEAGLHEFSINRTSSREYAGMLAAWTKPRSGSADDVARQYVDQHTGLMSFFCFSIVAFVGFMAFIWAFALTSSFTAWLLDEKEPLSRAMETWAISHSAKSSSKSSSKKSQSRRL